MRTKQPDGEDQGKGLLGLGSRRGFGKASFLLLGIFILVRGLVFPFLPCRSWGLSGYQCATPYLYLPLHKSHTCVAEKAFGEGARFTNRLDFVTYRSEKFTVDEHGYRNPPGTEQMRPRVLLSGSSFSLGASLNDEETLSTQLNNEIGPLVYNAATILGYDDFPSEKLRRLSNEMAMTKGWVLLEVNNRGPYAYKAPRSRSERDQQFEEEIERWKAPELSLYRRVVYCFALSRASSLINMRVHNDEWLPNPFKNGFAEEVLVSGRHMLFHARDKEFFLNPTKPDAATAAVVRFRDDLSQAGLRLAVLLVPTGYTVYHPLLRNREGGDSGAEYLSELTAQLEAKGIPTLNALPALREAAGKDLPVGNLVYWPDDAHWNGRGCATVARQAAPWLRALIDGQVLPGRRANEGGVNSPNAFQ